MESSKFEASGGQDVSPLRHNTYCHECADLNKRCRMRIKSKVRSFRRNNLYLTYLTIKNIPEIKFALSVLMVILIILLILDLIPWDKSGFLGNVLAEGHGLIFDLIVFGILIVVYDKLIVERRRKIEQYKDEIDILRERKDEEAPFMIEGIIKKLVKLGFNSIDVSKCNLENANLRSLRLNEAKFNSTNLKGANFSFAVLKGADFSWAKLQGAILSDADFTNAIFNHADIQNAKIVNIVATVFRGASFLFADLNGAYFFDNSFCNLDFRHTNLKKATIKCCNFIESDLSFADFEDATIIGSNFLNANLRNANLRNAILKPELEEIQYRGHFLHINKFGGADLTGANLEGAELQQVDFTGANLNSTNLLAAKNLTVEQLSKTKTLYLTKLDSELERQVKEKFRHLFENPEDKKVI